MRVSFSGEFAYEIYTPMIYQGSLYAAILQGGLDLRLQPARSRALTSLSVDKAFAWWGRVIFLSRLGVAMDRHLYDCDLIRKGVPSTPFPRRVPTATACYIIIPERAASLPRIKRFLGLAPGHLRGVRSL